MYENAQNVFQSEVKDDFIYCKLTRPTGSEGFLDLTNNWFQFHAAGPVSQGLYHAFKNCKTEL